MLFSSSIILTAIFAGRALSWGSMGHQTVAYVAYQMLSSETKTYLDGVLANDQGFDFGDAATWADRVRQVRKYTEPWHFIDAMDSPPKKCGVTYPDDCGTNASEGCIISAIANQTGLFTDTSQADEVRKEALMFLIHFIGDVHQPLHTENAFRGGTQLPVCFGHACAGVDLHAVWDTYIPHKIVGISHAAHPAEQKEAAKAWSERLSAAMRVDATAAECHDLSAPQKCALAWARQSNGLVCSYVMRQPVDWLESNDLSLEYYQGAKPIIERAITMAGVRLAGWLEAMVQAVERTGAASGNLEL